MAIFVFFANRTLKWGQQQKQKQLFVIIENILYTFFTVYTLYSVWCVCVVFFRSELCVACTSIYFYILSSIYNYICATVGVSFFFRSIITSTFICMVGNGLNNKIKTDNNEK